MLQNFVIPPAKDLFQIFSHQFEIIVFCNVTAFCQHFNVISKFSFKSICLFDVVVVVVGLCCCLWILLLYVSANTALSNNIAMNCCRSFCVDICFLFSLPYGLTVNNNNNNNRIITLVYCLCMPSQFLDGKFRAYFPILNNHFNECHSFVQSLRMD